MNYSDNVEVKLELFHGTAKTLDDLSHMYNVTTSQLVLHFITFCYTEWRKIMTPEELRRFHRHKLKRAEAKQIGLRARASHLANAVVDPL